ncbi:MAG: hypothetical protein ABI304_10370, partial [Rudaea sp.]
MSKLFVLVASSLFAIAAFAQDNGTVQVSSEVFHDTLPSLRNAPPQPHNLKNRIEHDLPIPYVPPNQVDGAVQSQARRSSSAPTNISSVDGIGDSFSGFSVQSAPPDTVGAVGLTQYVQVVNSDLAVFDKSTKATVFGPVSTNTLWAGFGGGCQTNDDGDAVVVYDKAADRWVVSQFSVSTTPYLECVAVSQTSDATGAWNRYAFSYGNTDFNDYPKMGVWPDGYYTTFNIFHGNTFAGSKLCAYDRTAMLANGSATQQCFQLSTSYGGVLPADLDGSIAPPAGSPNYLVNYGSNSLNLWKFHVDWSTPANSTLTGPTNIAVAAFTAACNGGTCITQPGTSTKLDSLADRMMFRLAYRNFGTYESLVASQSVKVSTHSGVRWYEIRSPGSTPVVYQQSTYSPDTDFRWMGSVAMDGQGNMALGYSVSGTSTFPSVRYTGRLVTDPVSTMQAEDSIVAGAGSQTGSLHRWGDYSAMTVDPTDDCTFWYTNEYIQANGKFNWRTRIGSFKFPSCGAVPATHTIGGSISGLTGSVQLKLDGTGPTSTQTQAYSSNGNFTFSTALDAGSNWSVSVVTQPIGQTCTLTSNSGTNLSADVTTVAVACVTNTYTLTYTAGANGSITGTSPQTVNYGASGTTVTAVPATGYHFLQWSDVSTANPRTDANVMANVTVTATFAIDQFTLTYAAGANGSITGTSPQTVNYGTNGTTV